MSRRRLTFASCTFLVSEWATRTALFDEQWFAEAAEYLYFQVKRGSGAAVPEFVTSRDAAEIVNGFEQHLTAHRLCGAVPRRTQGCRAGSAEHV
jgi:hypothetical protein